MGAGSGCDERQRGGGRLGGRDQLPHRQEQRRQLRTPPHHRRHSAHQPGGVLRQQPHYVERGHVGQLRAAQHPTLVATSRGVLIRAAGQDSDGAFRNDVITSSDGGKNWKVATAEAAWSARFVNTMLTIPSSIGGGKDITYVIAGRDTYDNYNDVWASSDDGKSWAVVSGQAPFMTRASANGAVTKDGLLIMAGGFADDVVGASNTAIANDVWLSMNGGYTWGRCVLDAEWDDRFQQAVAIDSDGYLLVLSGATGDVDSSYVLNDVWRSTTSFHDLSAIARVCGLTVPSCGTGLKCWPGADTVVATDGSFVSCSACPEYSVSSSTTNVTALVAALAVFVILFVVATAAAGYLWNKMQQANKEARRRMVGRRLLRRTPAVSLAHRRRGTAALTAAGLVREERGVWWEVSVQVCWEDGADALTGSDCVRVMFNTH